MLCANINGGDSCSGGAAPRPGAPKRKRRLAGALVAVALVLAAATVFFVSRSGEPPPEIGDIIEFGGYNWLVLDVQSDRALIITEDVIGQRTYHGRWVSVTWEASDMRRYLNGDFYNSFIAEERQRIAQTEVINNDNPWFGTPGGNDTVDKIFLLSLDELVKYFGDSGQLANRNHPDNTSGGFHDRYSNIRIAYILCDALLGWSSSNWWLRSPGHYDFNAAVVGSDGRVSVFGGLVLFNSVGVRPALWLYF